MKLGSSHDLTVNVPNVHLLPEHWPQLFVLKAPENDSKFVVRVMLSVNLSQCNCRELRYRPLDTNAAAAATI
jgi:hypothetical protein